MKVVISSRTLCVLLGLILCTHALHGTEPVPQALPWSCDFSTWDETSTNYPPGVVGWQIGEASRSTFILTPATSDADLITPSPSTAKTTAGGLHNYDNKLGFLDTGSGAYAIACAVCTTGRMNIRITFDIMTVRNPFNGTSNTRTNECGLFYRTGTSGDFTFANISYTNNAIQQITGTLPQNPQTFTIQLPACCDTQSVVQLRWSARDLTGGGYRPSFALARIQVESEPAPLLLFPPQNIRTRSSMPTRLDMAWDPVEGATAYSLDLYACSAVPGTPLLQETFEGFDGAGNLNLQDQLDSYTQTNGWIGNAVYESQGSVRLGNSTTRGWLQTPLLTHTGKCTFAFSACAWDYTDEATTIDAYCVQGNVTNILQTLCLSKTNLQTYVLQTQTHEPSRFGLMAKRNTNNRFFLDNLTLSPYWKTPVTNNLLVTGTSATFLGLHANTVYQGVIRSLNDTCTSPDSPPFTARTATGTLILLN
jgi:hypothetical protein